MNRPLALAFVVAYASGLVAQADTRLARETPQVWSVTPDSAVVAWFTSGDDARATVEFGPSTGYGDTVAAESRAWPLIDRGDRLQQHVARLTNLKPGTKYFYRVRADDAALTPTPGSRADDFHLVTAPPVGDVAPVDFLVLGDGGEGNKYQRAITYQMERTPHAFLLHTGDVVYDNGTDAEWSLNYYPIYRNLIRNRPWFLALGNHEYLGGPTLYVVGPAFGRNNDERLKRQEQFDAMPEKDPSPLVFKPQAEGTAAGYLENAILPDGPGRERYYSFDWGPVHVAVLDSNRNRTPGKPGDPQMKWLEADMAASRAPWKIVAFHHPMTSLGKPAYLFSAEGLVALRKDWHPIFERCGIDVVFNGHDHTYQRTWPIVVDPATGDISRDDARGIVHVVTGGGGGGITARSVTTAPAWHSDVFHKRHHFLSVRADAESLKITAIGDDDINDEGVSEAKGVGGPAEVLDTFTLQRRARPAR